MKVLLCHNYYQQPGGEDRSFFDEEWLLKSHGHEVIRYTIHNDVIEGMSSIRLAKKLIWNHDSYRELRPINSARAAGGHALHKHFPVNLTIRLLCRETRGCAGHTVFAQLSPALPERFVSS